MKKTALFIGLLALLPALARADQQPLPPDQVYRLQVQPQKGTILAHWDILSGYYLYKGKFQFISHTPGITLGAPRLPAGEQQHDGFFGDQEIYRNGVTAMLPYSGAGKLDLEVVYQGCADIGFCYPPQKKYFALTLAAAGTATTVRPPDLAALVSGKAGDQDFLPPDQAFRFSAYAKDANTVEVRWQIADGYYLYRQKFHFVSSAPGITLGAPGFPQGEIKNDQYFGTSEVYRHSVDALIPVTRSGAASQFILSATYQGCADKGLCYPPITRTASIDFTAPGSAPPVAAAPQANTLSAGTPPAEQNRLAQLIRSGNLALVFLAFVGLGLLLTFTPCVLPMIPILAGLIAGSREKPSTMRAFLLSLTYVLAMALTYTLAGIIVALVGANVQAWFQNPWIVGVFSAIFVLLALSMFGLFNLQMPATLQSRLTSWSNAQRGGIFMGVAVMGVLSALIVGPCITAPLVAALLVIGQSGDPVRGGLALFALGLGMGVPLLIVGTSAGRLIPRTGAWMNAVKYALGVILLGVAIWFLARILPGPVTLLLWAALAIICGVYLTMLDSRGSGWRTLWKGVGVLVGIYGIIMLVGAAMGGDDPLRPLARLSMPPPAASALPAASTGLQFTRIKTVADLQRAVAQANSQRRTVMLDFYADWCVSCKEMQHDTFTDARVQAALANTVLLQADVTANDADDQALLKHFGIYGPPSIMFFNTAGQELSAYRVVGYMNAREFTTRVQQALGNSSGAP